MHVSAGPVPARDEEQDHGRRAAHRVVGDATAVQGLVVVEQQGPIHVQVLLVDALLYRGQHHLTPAPRGSQAHAGSIRLTRSRRGMR